MTTIVQRRRAFWPRRLAATLALAVACGPADRRVEAQVLGYGRTAEGFPIGRVWSGSAPIWFGPPLRIGGFEPPAVGPALGGVYAPGIGVYPPPGMGAGPGPGWYGWSGPHHGWYGGWGWYGPFWP